MSVEDHLKRLERHYEASVGTAEDMLARCDRPSPYLQEAAKAYRHASASIQQAQVAEEPLRQALVEIAESFDELAGNLVGASFAAEHREKQRAQFAN